MTDVFITVDVECSMGGAMENTAVEPVPVERAIFCKIGSRYYGTPLLMDILDENGLRGTFFSEMLATRVLGDTDFADAYTEIAYRGHDVQLHLHPVYYFYDRIRRGEMSREALPPSPDWIGSLPPELQLALLREGTAKMKQLLGAAPVAFRAGSYAAGMETLRLLPAIGVYYDSSFNPAYDRVIPSREIAMNQPRCYGEVMELPLTVCQTGAWGMLSLKHLAIEALSTWEVLHVLENARAMGIPFVNLILHSFSLVKIPDWQFRRIRPDQIVIRRFEKLCRYLRQNSDRFRVRTFSERPVYDGYLTRAAVQNVGLLRPATRKLVQAVNRFSWL